MLLVVVGLAVAGCGSGPTANDPPKDKSEAPSKPAEQETASGAEDSLLAREGDPLDDADDSRASPQARI